jgi:hypothetical protein
VFAATLGVESFALGCSLFEATAESSTSAASMIATATRVKVLERVMFSLSNSKVHDPSGREPPGWLISRNMDDHERREWLAPDSQSHPSDEMLWESQVPTRMVETWTLFVAQPIAGEAIFSAA